MSRVQKPVVCYLNATSKALIFALGPFALIKYRYNMLREDKVLQMKGDVVWLQGCAVENESRSQGFQWLLLWQ